MKICGKILFILLIFFISCSRPDTNLTDQELIERLMEQRARAIENEDLKVYLNCISDRYNQGGLTKKHLKKRIRRTFRMFDGIDFQIKKQDIYIKGDEATLIQEVVLSGFIEGERTFMPTREKISLLKEKGRWLIVGGL